MDETTNDEEQAISEIAATGSPHRLQFLMNQSAAHLGELIKDLHENMSEVRVVTSLMKGAMDLWNTGK